MDSPTLRIIVVDDEQLAREELAFLLGQLGDVEVVGHAGTGIEVARRLLRAGIDTQLVFVTAYDQHAIEAFEVNAVDYLLKPVEAGRLATAVDRVRRRVESDRVQSKTPSAEEMDKLLQLLSERQGRREQLALKVADRFLLVQS